MATPLDANAAKRSLNISNIPMELLLMIYENADLKTLINVAKSHPYNHRAAGLIFKSKFANERFIIDGLDRSAADFLTRDRNSFDMNVVVGALHTFGHLITKLTIDYGLLDDQQMEQINENVSECVAGSLTELELKGCHDHKLKGLRGPFKSVDLVCLRYGYVISSDIDFNEMFPSVRVIDVRSMLSLSPQSSDHHFANLEEMHLEYYLVNDSPRMKLRLQLNPQLKRISVFETNWPGLRMISETLPGLEQLDVLSFSHKSSTTFQAEDIRFTNLKAFGMHDYSSVAMERVPLVFGGLEQITCNAPIDNWMQIILQNKQLKRINCRELNGDHLQQITGELPFLEEIQAKFAAVGSDSIDKAVLFIEGGNRLKKVIFSNMSAEYGDQILERLQYKWKIIREGNDCVLTRH